MPPTNKTANILAAIMLAAMFFLSLGAMAGDSLTMDEKSHLPAGYSYVTQKDMRINPEHPPLVKDLAGLPLVFIPGITFPYNDPSWTEMVNGQWDFGAKLLFNSGNPADKMIFWGRLPMLLMSLVLGFYVFKWARELFGNTAGLLALFLYSFSPTFLAHGHLVTTDVAAALGAVVATYYFVNALRKPNWRNAAIAGAALGIAESLKFSMILLFPLFILLAALWWAARLASFRQMLKIIFASFAICFLVIWPIYQFHVWNYPAARQVSDTKTILASHGFKLGTEIIVWAADKPVLRPWAQYFLGVMMVTQRVTGGNTTYFLGEISKTSWKTYFPVVYLAKETLAFHLVSLTALILAAAAAIKNRRRFSGRNCRDWLSSHAAIAAMAGFIAIYWASSIGGNLNIGVRHLMPVFPMTMILAAGGATTFLPKNKFKNAFIGALCAWQLVSVISAYPGFLAYYNEFAGGAKNGPNIAVDSNLDWGQDLKRLKIWADDNGVEKIYIDYFGGADPQYYFGPRVERWWSSRDKNEIPAGGYLAVSATFLQGQRARTAPGSSLVSGEYLWLDRQQLAAIIGNSIFVYKIN